MIVLHICTSLKIPSFHPTDNGVFSTNSYFTTSKLKRNIENTFSVFIVFPNVIVSSYIYIKVAEKYAAWLERKEALKASKRRKDDMRD